MEQNVNVSVTIVLAHNILNKKTMQFMSLMASKALELELHRLPRQW